MSHELLQVRSECDNIAPQLNELRMAYATRGEELEQLRALRNQLEANIGSIEKREKQLLSELANALQNETKLKFELAASEKNCTDLAQVISKHVFFFIYQPPIYSISPEFTEYLT